MVLTCTACVEGFTRSALFKQVLLVIGTVLNVAGQASASIGIPVILIAQLREPDSGIVTSTSIEAWIASIVSLGQSLGVWFVPLLLDRIGRKKCHLLTIIPTILGWIVVICTTNVYVMLAARFFQGLAIGLRMPVSSIIIAECTSPKYRGSFLATINFSIAVGVFYPHLIGTFLSWRITSVACALLSMISLVFIAFIPDSPTWLVKVGRIQEARAAFEWFRGNKANTPEEFDEILKKVTEDNKIEANDFHGFRNMITDLEFWRPFFIVLVANLAYNSSGFNVMTNYMIDILSESFSDDAKSYYVMIAVDVFRMIVSLVGCFIIKKFNRKTVYQMSSWISILALVILSSYIYISRKYNFHHEFILIASLLIYIYGGSGLQSMQYVLIGEVFPIKYKSSASALAVSMSAGLAFVVLLSAPYLFKSLGRDGTFLIYAFIVFVCWIFMYFKFPETKDKTLIHIENENACKGNRITPN